MSRVKRFFLIYAAVYLAVSITILVLYGPPGFTEEYTEKYERESEHYHEIIARDEYKLWEQRPHLHKPAAAFERDLAFVEHYEANPDFQAEMARRAMFGHLTKFFNAFMVVVLMVRFGRKPISDFLGKQVDIARERLDGAEAARKNAEAEIEAANAKLAGLEAERRELETHNAALIAQEQAHAEERARVGVEEIDLETEQRKHAAAVEAWRQVRAELVNKAVAQLMERYTSEASPERVTRLTEEFARQLEERA